MARVKPRKMKPLMAWAIVHDDGAIASNPWSTFSLCGTQEEAKVMRKSYGALARIARVRITEVKP